MTVSDMNIEWMPGCLQKQEYLKIHASSPPVKPSQCFLAHPIDPGR